MEGLPTKRFLVVKLFKIAWFFPFCFHNGWFPAIWYGDDNATVDGLSSKSELVFEWLLGKPFPTVELLRILWLSAYCLHTGNDCLAAAGCFPVSDVAAGGLSGKRFPAIEMPIDKLATAWFRTLCFHDNGFLVIWFRACFFADGWFPSGEFRYPFVKVPAAVSVTSVFLAYPETVGIKGSRLLSSLCWLTREEFEFRDEIVVLLKRFVSPAVKLSLIPTGTCDLRKFKSFPSDKFCRCWFMKSLTPLKLSLLLSGRSIITNMTKEKCAQQGLNYPGPGGFSWAAKEPRSGEDESQSGENRKTSGYLGVESHFHADARVRIWPSGSHWLIFLQTRKSIWLICLNGNTEGTRDC